MKSDLKELCEQFINYKDAIKKAFPKEFDSAYSVCANIILSHHREADIPKLKECLQYMNESAVFGKFNSISRACGATMLSCSGNVEKKAAKAVKNYEALTELFPECENTAQTSFMLANMTNLETSAKKIARGGEILELMKETGSLPRLDEDFVYTVHMAFSEKSNTELLQELQSCYLQLKDIAPKEDILLVSFILSLGKKSAVDKAESFRALLECVAALGMKYDKNSGLAILAALADLDADIIEIVSDISDANDFLSKSKDYKGMFGADRQDRVMYATMLVLTMNLPSPEDDEASNESFIQTLAALMMTMLTITTHLSESNRRSFWGR